MSRRVVLVCGPPAAGKTTWVAEHAEPGDRVVDLDAICQRLGSTEPHQHPQHVLEKARRTRAAEEALVARMSAGTAWVIRTMPEPDRRARHAAALGATEVVVLAADPATAKARAERDSRPAWTGAVIDRWWSRYRPSTSRLEREIPMSQPQEGSEPMPDETEQTSADTAVVDDPATQAGEGTDTDTKTGDDAPAGGDTAPQEGKADEEPFDAKRAQAKIHKANQEAANLRKRLRELEPLAAKAKEYEEAQQTETERLQSRLTEREQEIGRLRKRAVKSEVRALAAPSFADVTDPEAHLDLDGYVGDDGEIDTDRIKADLVDLLDRKPHLGKPKPKDPDPDTEEPRRRRPAPDRTQASGANQTRPKSQADEFAAWTNTRLLKGRR